MFSDHLLQEYICSRSKVRLVVRLICAGCGVLLRTECHAGIPLICQSLCDLAVGGMRCYHTPLRKDKEVIEIEGWATEIHKGRAAHKSTGLYRQGSLHNYTHLAICVCYCSVCLWESLFQLQ